eukprot:10975945-Lingulodinium_polyedra.AAC.1
MNVCITHPPPLSSQFTKALALTAGDISPFCLGPEQWRAVGLAATPRAQPVTRHQEEVFLV